MVANVASRPAGMSEPEMPELSDGALQDWDIDLAPRVTTEGDVPGPVELHVRVQSATSKVGHTDVTTCKELPYTEDVGTQVDREIQAGPPGGVSALALADFVATNPGLGPTLTANWLAD